MQTVSVHSSGQQGHMRQIGPITLILTFLTIGCQPTKNQETVETADSLSNERVDAQDKIDESQSAHNTEKAKEFSDFEMTFEYEDKEQKFRQRLGVTWVKQRLKI